MKCRNDLTADQVRQTLDYNPETGSFLWKERSVEWFKSKRDQKIWNTRYANKSPEGTHPRGYKQICINGVRYLAHRLSWLYIFGVWPEGELDHINRDPADNRIANLRPANRSLNNQNTGKRKGCSSNHKGVYWHKERQKWMARIHINNRCIFLGRYETQGQAARAYAKASDEMHEYIPTTEPGTNLEHGYWVEVT